MAEPAPWPPMIPEPMTEPPDPPTSYAPINAQRAAQGLQPTPERIEYDGTLRHDTGPMHETAIRATAITAAVAVQPGMNDARTLTLEEFDRRVRITISTAKTFAHYITTGERPE